MLLKLLLDPANVDTNFFVDGATGDFGDAPIELEATATPDGLAHQLSFVASDSIATAEFLVTGTDADGRSQTELVTGVTDTPVETTKYFLTVESIASEDDIGAETLDVGFVDKFVSPTIELNWRVNAPSRWFGDQNGTITWSVDFAIADPGLFQEQNAIPWKNPSTSLEAETADSTAFVEVGAGYTAARIRVASYTDTADLTIYASQPELPA